MTDDGVFLVAAGEFVFQFQVSLGVKHTGAGEALNAGSRGRLERVSYALVLEVLQTMFQHALHGSLHGVVAAAHLEAQRCEFFHGNCGTVVTVFPFVSTNVGENFGQSVWNIRVVASMVQVCQYLALLRFV